MPGRGGFTLLEMVIVVAILAILAAVAMRSMGSLDQQARLETTQRSMRDLGDAVLASGRDADGSLLVSGFVADLGRLPWAFGIDPNSQLQELWSNPRGLAAFALRPSTSDTEVYVACGWRGNYLQLGAGQSDLRDGWGQGYDLLRADGVTPVNAGDPVAIVRSRGADNAIGGSADYDVDITAPLGGQPSTPGGDITKATIGGRVLALDANTGLLRDPDPNTGAIVVRYFGPNPATGGVLELTDANAAVPAYAYSIDGTAGPRVLRAYQGALRSTPIRVMLQPGGQVKDLVLK